MQARHRFDAQKVYGKKKERSSLVRRAAHQGIADRVTPEAPVVPTSTR